MTKNNLSSNTAIRVYLGGSFDPVHLGHIQMAMVVYHCLAPIARKQQRMLQVSLLPNARSPFKKHSTDPEHRLAMLQLAIQDTPLRIDALELWQTPPVYTIDSVRTLRQRYPNDSLIFIMGMDSARSLDRWQNGLELTDYVHLWVFDRIDISAKRSGTKIQNDTIDTTYTMNTMRRQFPAELQAQITDCTHDLIKPLKNNSKGCIYIDSHTITSISSTQIREQLRQSLSVPTFASISDTEPQAALMPITSIHDTAEIILLDKWLNPAVYHYIMTHQLYSAA